MKSHLIINNHNHIHFQYISMASFNTYLLLLAILFHTASAQNGLILPIRKDKSTSQFYTTIHMGSNRASINTVIDLGSEFLWFSCNDYTSTTYAPIPCGSSKCATTRSHGCFGCNLPPRPGCTNDTCASSPFNPFQGVLVAQGFAEDTLSSTNNDLRVPQFLFSCMHSDDLQGLASGTTGMLGLARTDISLHKQVATKLNLPNKFSLCLPSSGIGKLSIGGGKSINSLKTTPLIINSVSTGVVSSQGQPSDEYFIDVKSIRVDGKSISVKDSYLTIDKNGVGGTKISSIQNYTALHSSIYKPLTRAFVKAAADMRIESAGSVAPFRACFRSGSIRRGLSGPVVPTIDLVLGGNDVYWRIEGGNSMVEIDRDIMCLGFVDGGSRPRTSVVIGVHQLEENYLEFDLVSSQLKFTSLLLQNKSCSRI